jgi:hypothetical protein
MRLYSVARAARRRPGSAKVSSPASFLLQGSFLAPGKWLHGPVREPDARLRDNSRVKRRWGLIATGIATLLLLLAMSPAEDRMTDTGPGMVPFELTGGQDRADEILAEWGDEGQDAARESLWIDFGFLLAYGAFLTLALAATRDLARERGWRRLAATGAVVVSFGAVGAAFDALENACLLLTLEGAGAALPLLATIFASCKFILIAIAIAYLLAGLAARLISRLQAPRAP